jgi:hypothetical protein
MYPVTFSSIHHFKENLPLFPTWNKPHIAPCQFQRPPVQPLLEVFLPQVVQLVQSTGMCNIKRGPTYCNEDYNHHPQPPKGMQLGGTAGARAGLLV